MILDVRRPLSDIVGKLGFEQLLCAPINIQLAGAHGDHHTQRIAIAQIIYAGQLHDTRLTLQLAHFRTLHTNVHIHRHASHRKQ